MSYGSKSKRSLTFFKMGQILKLIRSYRVIPQIVRLIPRILEMMFSTHLTPPGAFYMGQKVKFHAFVCICMTFDVSACSISLCSCLYFTCWFIDLRYYSIWSDQFQNLTHFEKGQWPFRFRPITQKLNVADRANDTFF